jgi:hypothetical protein
MWPLFQSQPACLSFAGGPLDGYEEENDTPLRDLPEVLGILVSPQVVESLTTHETAPQALPTSLAFYQQYKPKKRHYTFVGSTAPEMAELN